MRVLKIDEIYKLDHDELIPSVKGVLIELKMSTPAKSDYNPNGTLQNGILRDNTGEIKIKFRDRPELPQHLLNREIYIECKEGDKGKSGIKAKDDTYRGETNRIISVTSTALINEADGVADNEPPPEENRNRGGQRSEAPPRQAASQQPSAPARNGNSQHAAAPTPLKAPETNGNGNGHSKAGMQCTQLYYERVVNTGNYCNEKIGITLAIEEGVKASDALALAKQFVDKNIAPVGVDRR